MKLTEEAIIAKFNELSRYQDFDNNEFPILTIDENAGVELVQWTISQMQPDWVAVTYGYPEIASQCYFYRKGISNYVYTGCYIGIHKNGDYHFQDEDDNTCYYRDVTHYLPFSKPQPPTK